MTPHTHNHNATTSQRKTTVTRRTKSCHASLLRRGTLDLNNVVGVRVGGKPRKISAERMKRRKLMAKMLAKRAAEKDSKRQQLNLVQITDIAVPQPNMSAVEQQKFVAEILEDGPEDKYEFLARLFEEDF